MLHNDNVFRQILSHRAATLILTNKGKSECTFSFIDFLDSVQYIALLYGNILWPYGNTVIFFTGNPALLELLYQKFIFLEEYFTGNPICGFYIKLDFQLHQNYELDIQFLWQHLNTQFLSIVLNLISV